MRQNSFNMCIYPKGQLQIISLHTNSQLTIPVAVQTNPGFADDSAMSLNKEAAQLPVSAFLNGPGVCCFELDPHYFLFK